MLASRLHWRLLIGTILVLMTAALLAPRWVPAPDMAENRVLAPAPTWPKRLDEFREFRTGVDAYVADHFPSRPHLIGVFNRLRMLVGVSGSERVIIGRNGWLFFDNGSHLGAARNDPPMGAEAIRGWLTFLAGATEAHKAQGAAFLVVVPPIKEIIYPEHLPSWYPGASPDRPALALPKLARAAGAGEVLYLYDAVAAATREGQKTYSRHDTHWTSYGGYAGYAALMNRLQALGLTPEGPLPRSAFEKNYGDPGTGPRDLALMLGVASFVDIDFPSFSSPENQARMNLTYLSEKEDWTGPLFIETGEVGKPVLMMRRDSFSASLVPFLYPHFSRLVLIHTQDREWRQDLLDRFRPDIVILQVVEGSLPVAPATVPPPSPEAVARIDTVIANLPATISPLTPRLSVTRGRMLREMTSAIPRDRCNVEVATLARASDGRALLSLRGWTADFEGDNQSPDGLLRLTGPGVDVSAKIAVDTPRPDVAAHFNRPAAANTGFAGEFAVSPLPPGAYEVTVYRRALDGWISCAGRDSLALR